MSVAIVVPSDGAALEASQVGTTFERVPHGWRVKWVDGGTTINVEGATITEALGSHGMQIVHPSIAKENAEIAAKEAAEDAADEEAGIEPKRKRRKSIEEKRAPVDEQPIALAIAEEKGVLPDEDRRAPS